MPQDPEDIDADFAEAVKDVKPLKPTNLADPPRNRILLQGDPKPVLSDSGMNDGDERGWMRNGIQKSVLRRLRSGQIPVEDILDLHGHTVVEAERAVRLYIAQAQAEGRQRAVRVIHGKGIGSPNGIPILKEKMSGWLRQSDAVLAFCVATPADGGTGALNVLLRRK
jgi:DNA-nicking Smr family endonuclease